MTDHMVLLVLLYFELSISFLIGQKCTMKFWKQHLWCHLAADYLYNIYVKGTQGHGELCYVRVRCMISKGNHVMLFAFSEEAKMAVITIFFVHCIIKKLLHSVFVISWIIKVLVRVISLSLQLLLITLLIQPCLFWI